MKIYLSNYWRKSSIFTVCMTVIIVVATTAFFVWSHDEEDYILIIGAVFFIFLFGYLQLNTLKLLDYVEVTDNQFVMRSFIGKRKCVINSNDLVYYQIVSLVEGINSGNAFIVLSNQKFTPYKTGNGLAKVYKDVNSKGNQIIMPYNKTTIPLFSSKDWYKIN